MAAVAATLPRMFRTSKSLHITKTSSSSSYHYILKKNKAKFANNAAAKCLPAFNRAFFLGPYLSKILFLINRFVDRTPYTAYGNIVTNKESKNRD